MAPDRRPLSLTRVLTLAVVLATATSCATGKSRGDSKPTADKYYEVALGSFHNGMVEDAKIQIDRALDADPKHAESLYLRGLIELQSGKNMVSALEMELCLTDEAAELQRERADELHRAALASFKAAAQAFPEDAPGRGRAFNSMATVSLYFDDFDTAIEQCRAALGVDFYTERYSALANLGWAYYGKGDLIQAMTELRQSVMLNPDFCVGRYRLAEVYAKYDLYPQAFEEVSRVVEDARCPIQEAYQLHADLSIALGQAAEAAESLTTCVEVAPRSCRAQSCRASASAIGATIEPRAPRSVTSSR